MFQHKIFRFCISFTAFFVMLLLFTQYCATEESNSEWIPNDLNNFEKPEITIVESDTNHTKIETAPQREGEPVKHNAKQLEFKAVNNFLTYYQAAWRRSCTAHMAQ